MVAKCRCEDPPRRPDSAEIQLAAPGETVTDLPPPHKIGAVEEGDSGEVFQTGVDEVEITSHTADTRVRVESWKDRSDHGEAGAVKDRPRRGFAGGHDDH
jgi:hypothetical protein